MSASSVHRCSSLCGEHPRITAQCFPAGSRSQTAENEAESARSRAPRETVLGACGAPQKQHQPQERVRALPVQETGRR